MELVHLLNRGVEKRNIFLDDQDRNRFVVGLELFNDHRPIDNIHRIINGSYVRLTKSNNKLVQIHGWCLMRNHYHLLLSELSAEGITKFIRKLNIGYSKYFNEKYKRSGTLFQGRTRKIPILTNAHYLHILNYIHLNPLDYTKSCRNWREGKVSNPSGAIKSLQLYPWSSYHDYCGESKFPNVTTTDVFKDNYVESLRKYLKDMELDTIKTLSLE